MRRKKIYKIAAAVILSICWAFILSGLFYIPAIIFILLSIITFIFLNFYFYDHTHRKSPREAIKAMDDYMERKAQEQLGKPDEEQDESEESEDEYNFNDDVKIIKR